MTLDSKCRELVAEFERLSGLKGIEWSTVQKQSSTVLVINLSYPSDRFFEILENASINVGIEDLFLTPTIKSRSGDYNLIDAAEGKYLVKVLSETLNVNRFTFGDDFFSRYTKSVAGAETQIVANANHVVLGRRGAGKSMLLLFAWHSRVDDEKPSIWVDMQVYSGRDDIDLVKDVLIDLVEQAAEFSGLDATAILDALRSCESKLSEIRKILPNVRKYLSYFSSKKSEVFVFLDDFHVVDMAIQPILLDVIYAVCRGNQVFLKISAIETLTKTYDSATSTGIEVPQDAQNIKLDYNLTMPDKATAHIEAILNSHAEHAGIRSIRRLCVSPDVIPRLTWVAAGVPRDALNLFSQAMLKASLEGRKRVSVSNINVAASETLSIKLREIETDASDKAAKLQELVEDIKYFCISEEKKNSFLIEIGVNAEIFAYIMNLVHLRLLHVITEGITVGDAGRKFMGLILDYGFYTGIRAAQSVDLFNRQSKKVAYKDLRGLPILPLAKITLGDPVE
ncbi:hypothetical protein [Devosia sp.]|uniref:hypothetical protein n=1 Tax=Devosia sp. TaxID=1871048 RepID=UPI002FCC2D83